MIGRALMGVAVLVAALSFPAAAQELPPGKWWHRPEVVRSLGLSPQQRTQLDEIVQRTAPELIDLKADVEKKAIVLRGQLDRPSLDRASIQHAAEQVSRARGRLFERELMMLIDMRGVLEDDQWSRFRTFLDRRGARGMGQRGNMPERRPGPGRRP